MPRTGEHRRSRVPARPRRGRRSAAAAALTAVAAATAAWTPIRVPATPSAAAHQGSTAVAAARSGIPVVGEKRWRTVLPRPSRDGGRDALPDATDRNRSGPRSPLQTLARREARQRADALAVLRQRSTARAEVLHRRLWVSPLAGRHQVTAGFGEVSGLWASTHTGVDLSAAYGAPVRSVAAGVVVSARYDGAYGYKVVVRHADRTTTWYCHLDRFAVHRGAHVARGSRLGWVGMSGNSTGAHLHLEVHPDGRHRAADPLPALRRHGATFGRNRQGVLSLS